MPYKSQAAANVPWVLSDFQMYARRMKSLCLLCGVLTLRSGMPTLLLQADWSKSLIARGAPPPQTAPPILNSTSVQARSNLPALSYVAISPSEFLARKNSAERFIPLRCN